MRIEEARGKRSREGGEREGRGGGEGEEKEKGEKEEEERGGGGVQHKRCCCSLLPSLQSLLHTFLCPHFLPPPSLPYLSTLPSPIPSSHSCLHFLSPPSLPPNLSDLSHRGVRYDVGFLHGCLHEAAASQIVPHMNMRAGDKNSIADLGGEDGGGWRRRRSEEECEGEE